MPPRLHASPLLRSEGLPEFGCRIGALVVHGGTRLTVSLHGWVAALPLVAASTGFGRVHAVAVTLACAENVVFRCGKDHATPVGHVELRCTE